MTIDLFSLSMGAGLVVFCWLITAAVRFGNKPSADIKAKIARLDYGKPPAGWSKSEPKPESPVFISFRSDGSGISQERPSKDILEAFKKELTDSFAACGQQRQVVIVPYSVSVDFE